MNKFRILTTLLALGAPVALGACDHIGPTPMPTGYSYHDQKYKAPPGPKAVAPYDEIAAPAPLPGATAPQPAAPAASVAWTPVFTDLLTKIEAKFGMLVDPVWVEPSGNLEADAALHAVMNERGYHLAAAPGTSPYLMKLSIGTQSVELALMSGAAALAVENAAVAMPEAPVMMTPPSAEMPPADMPAEAGEPVQLAPMTTEGLQQ